MSAVLAEPAVVAPRSAGVALSDNPRRLLEACAAPGGFRNTQANRELHGVAKVSSVAALLNHLVQSGYLRHDGERRHFVFTITPHGLQVLQTAATRTRYAPRVGGRSLVARVREFFAVNPDEELTYADMELKFGAARETCRSAVRDLMREGRLEALHLVRTKQRGRAA